jgi:hypothetical protein
VKPDVPLATLLISAILVNSPEWAPTAGEQYGIFAAVTLFGPLISLVLGSKGNRMLDTTLMLLSVVAAVAIFITLLATAQPKASAVSRGPITVALFWAGD